MLILSDANHQTSSVILHALSSSTSESTASVNLMDFPGLTGDAHYRDEAMQCRGLANFVIVVISGLEIGRGARKAVCEALLTVGADKTKVHVHFSNFACCVTRSNIADEDGVCPTAADML